jgi:hypothetical protein
VQVVTLSTRASAARPEAVRANVFISACKMFEMVSCRQQT